MANSAFKPGRISIKAQVGWGTPMTTFADVDAVAAEAFVPTPATETVGIDLMKTGFAASPKQSGRTRGDLTVKFPLHGLSASTPTADPTAHIDALLMQWGFGGVSIDGYGTIIGTPDTQAIQYAVTPSGQDGHAALAQSTHSSGRAVHWCEGVTGDEATSLEECRGGADFAVGQAYGSVTAYLDRVVQPLTLQWQGDAATSLGRYSDAAIQKLEIDLSAGKQPMVTATLKSLEATLVGSGGAPAPLNYSYPQMPISSPANGAWAAIASTEQTLGKCILTIERTLVEVESHSASIWICTDIKSTLTVSGPITDASALAEAGTAVGAIQIDANTTPGRAFSLLIPNAVHAERQKLIEVAGEVLGVESVYDVGYYDGDGTSVAPADTICRVAFM